MKFPVAWICCIIMIVISVYILVNRGYSDEEFIKQAELMKAKAINECSSHRMTYTGALPKTYYVWTALCCTESPFKIYEFQMEDV